MTYYFWLGQQAEDDALEDILAAMGAVVDEALANMVLVEPDRA